MERSDQIEDTEATRGPRRPKGFVMAAQGHGEHPAAASVGKRSGYKSTRTKLETQGRVLSVEFEGPETKETIMWEISPVLISWAKFSARIYNL